MGMEALLQERLVEMHLPMEKTKALHPKQTS